MKIFRYLLLLTYTCCLSSISAQSGITDEEIWVVQKDQKLYFKHVVERGNTLYGLARSYGMSSETFSSKVQGLTKDNLQIGDTLWIPLEKEMLTSLPSKPSKAIYYRVQPKENLFRIARIYLGVKEEQVMVMNRMESIQVNIDQDLLLGYLDFKQSKIYPMETNVKTPLNSSPKVVTTEPTKPNFEQQNHSEQNPLKQEVAVEPMHTVTKTYQERSGVAIWFDDTDSQSGLFVMHESAPVNSILHITNPMFNKTIQAKVVGNIPPNTYPKEVIVVISPAVAKSLGALDKRFFTKIKYEVHTLQ
jgi:peptidoglycan endopeptidase LytF